MKLVRLASAVLVAVIVMSLGVASVAVAAGPLFLTSGKPTLTGTSGTVKFASPGASTTLSCAKSSATGEVSSTTLAGNLHVHFLECEAEKAGSTCPVMSTGAPATNLILTNTLHGVLGLVLPKPSSGSDVGLLLLPSTSGANWYTLLGSCMTKSAAEGSLAGLVEPVGTLSTTGKLVFGVTGGKQNINEIDLTNGPSVEPEFIWFSVTSTVEATVGVTFGARVEVM